MKNRSSLRREIAEHDARCKEIRDGLRLGNLLNQYDFARRMGDDDAKEEVLYNIYVELNNLDLARLDEDAEIEVVSLKSKVWVSLHDPEWGLVHYGNQLLIKQVNAVLNAERAKKLAERMMRKQKYNKHRVDYKNEW